MRRRVPLRPTGRWLLLLASMLAPATSFADGRLKGVVIGADRAPIAGARVVLTAPSPVGAPGPGGSPPATGAPRNADGRDGWFVLKPLLPRLSTLVRA